jgi:hypothetical protein
VTKTCNPVETARAILAAMRAADLPALDRRLREGEALAAREPASPALVAEQRELLAAIAAQVRRSFSRFTCGVTPHLEDFETHLRLLRHLAA